MSTNRLSLAQQIALLEEAAPIDLDPEDVHSHPDVPSSLTTNPAAREHYLDVGPSALRKHDSISDPKYEGVKTTRKQMMIESSSEGSESGHDEESDDNSLDGIQAQASELGEESDEENGKEGVDITSRTSEGEGESCEGGVDGVRRRGSTSDFVEMPEEAVNEPPEDFSSILRQKREEDRRKGKAISRQMGLWDGILDARIRMQKTLAAVNQLPKPLDIRVYAQLPECQHVVNKMLSEAIALSSELFELQEDLLASNESILPPPRKRQKIRSSNESIGYEKWFEDATSDIASLEKSYHPHFVQTLAKWSAKVRAVAPSALLSSSRNAFAAKGSRQATSVIQLIDDTLVDHDKILARTQIWRGKGRRVGEDDSQEEQRDSEIFDDTDFYQQLLRSVIDSRAPGAGDDWVSIQKQKKAKKKVDTKASKGRKLRYEVHEKLQNFMVPVPVMGRWHEEQVDELFASILGKAFESALRSDDDPGGIQEEEVDESLRNGFRVFG